MNEILVRAMTISLMWFTHNFQIIFSKHMNRYAFSRNIMRDRLHNLWTIDERLFTIWQTEHKLIMNMLLLPICLGPI